MAKGTAGAFKHKSCLKAIALKAAIAIGAVMASQIAFAQAGPAFAVSPAIVGGGPGAARRMAVSRTPGRIAFEAALVGDIMAFAYGLPLDRVERRPQWMYDDRYDVAVTTTTPASLPEQKLMLQKLLEERFGLVVHRVSYPSPVYYLVRGPKVNLTETQEGDSEDVTEFRMRGGAIWFPGHASMSDLAGWLYPQMGLPVVDKTGITGLFDIDPPQLGRGGAENTIRAVRDWFGLELELNRDGTAESLIIDHVEKPSQN